MRTLPGLILCVALSNSAFADLVYKCKGEGITNYSQTQCDNGLPLTINDARTAEQRAQSEANTRRLSAQADALQKQRNASDAMAAKRLAELARTNQKSPQLQTEPVRRVYIHRVQTPNPSFVRRTSNR